MTFQTRPRFIRTPPPPKAKAAPAPKLEPVERVYAAPVTQSKGARQWKVRDDCPTCAAKRDQFGRLEVGLCGSSCLMARPKA